MKYLDVEKFISNHPRFKSRADQYLAMSEYFGIEPETIKEMMSFSRYLREIWPIDEIGEEKARDWRPSGSFKKEECRLDLELPRILSQ